MMRRSALPLPPRVPRGHLRTDPALRAGCPGLVDSDEAGVRCVRAASVVVGVREGEGEGLLSVNVLATADRKNLDEPRNGPFS